MSEIGPGLPVIEMPPPSAQAVVMVPVAGPPGPAGPPGADGDGSYDDIPDLTLILENGLA